MSWLYLLVAKLEPDPDIPGGGLPKMWSSMLEQNSVWNGGSKIEKWCGIVWTQNGGKICMTECDMGVKFKMTQNVCGMGGFLAQKTDVLRLYLLLAR